jgi:hypothetical protein
LVFRFKNLGRWLRKSRIKEELGRWLRKSKNQENQESKEEKMKKLIAVAAILSVMFLGAGTSQALMGTPDAVPGRDVLIPFFIVSMDGMGSDNTLITVTEVMGQDNLNVNDPDYGTEVHLVVYDRDSIKRYDKWITLTPYDVYVTNASVLIDAMGDDDRDACKYDMDDNGTDDCYVGYVRFENNETSPINNLISHAYQVAATDGIVAGVNGVSLEDAAGGGGAADALVAYDEWSAVEALSANALLAAKLLLNGETVDVDDDATWFRLLQRVYLHDSDSINHLIIWTDREEDGADADTADDLPLPGLLHVNFFDEEEHAASASILIDHELTFINMARKYPSSLQGTDPIAAGWVDIRTPDLDGAGWTTAGTDFPACGHERLWLGYSLQRAVLGTTSLDVIFEAHRDAGTGDQPGPQ